MLLALGLLTRAMAEAKAGRADAVLLAAVAVAAVAVVAVMLETAETQVQGLMVEMV